MALTVVTASGDIEACLIIGPSLCHSDWKGSRPRLGQGRNSKESFERSRARGSFGGGGRNTLLSSSLKIGKQVDNNLIVSPRPKF